jgi:hypothetical protein
MEYSVGQKLVMYGTFVRMLVGGNAVENFLGSILMVRYRVKQRFTIVIVQNYVIRGRCCTKTNFEGDLH